MGPVGFKAQCISISHILAISVPCYLWCWVSGDIAVESCHARLKYCLVSWVCGYAWCNWNKLYFSLYFISSYNSASERKTFIPLSSGESHKHWGSEALQYGLEIIFNYVLLKVNIFWDKAPTLIITSIAISARFLSVAQFNVQLVPFSN